MPFRTVLALRIMRSSFLGQSIQDSIASTRKRWLVATPRNPVEALARSRLPFAPGGPLGQRRILTSLSTRGSRPPAVAEDTEKRIAATETRRFRGGDPISLTLPASAVA